MQGAPLKIFFMNLLVRINRFGHDTLSDCHYCRSINDFGLYALPRSLLEYVREASVLGLVTIRGSHHGRWRLYSIIVLFAAFAGEMYHLNTVPIIVKPPLKMMIFVCPLCSFNRCSR